MVTMRQQAVVRALRRAKRKRAQRAGRVPTNARSLQAGGRAWRYFVGRQRTRIWPAAGGPAVLVENWVLTGCGSPDVFDRGKWKGARDGMVTPRNVADYIEDRLANERG